MQQFNKLVVNSKNDSWLLTREDFHKLTEVPEVIEWLMNIENELTREAYRRDVAQFSSFVGIKWPEDFRVVTRAHIIVWRDQMKSEALWAASVRRKISALSSLFNYLCNKNCVDFNPVSGVSRPKEGANIGKTPALSWDQARALLDAPPMDTIKGIRDRAILATFLLHGLRESEVSGLKLSDIQHHEGIPHFQVHGKRSKIRYIPINPIGMKRIQTYLTVTKHGWVTSNPLFVPVRNNLSGELIKTLSRQGIYDLVVKWGLHAGIPKANLHPHVLRATSATKALKNNADLAAVQEWLGHSDISTTRMYDKRVFDVEESPSYKIAY